MRAVHKKKRKGIFYHEFELHGHMVNKQSSTYVWENNRNVPEQVLQSFQQNFRHMCCISSPFNVTVKNLMNVLRMYSFKLT